MNKEIYVNQIYLRRILAERIKTMKLKMIDEPRLYKMYVELLEYAKRQLLKERINKIKAQ